MKLTVVALMPLKVIARVSVALPKPEPLIVTTVPTGPLTGEIESIASPAQLISRSAASDVEIAGRKIKGGDSVIGLLGAANRDPDVFDDPETLNLMREPCNHLSFSAGIHFCLGAQLARLEGQIALSTLVRRFPNIALASDDLRYRAAPILRGLEALPVTF